MKTTKTKSKKTEVKNPITYTESDKQVLDYLKQSFDFLIKERPLPKGFVYKGQYDFILQHGKFYQSQELTDKEREIVNNAIKNLGFKPRMKECFYNAQMLAINDPTGQIQYCEGFGLCIIPTNHGWCVINDKVIDLTWKDESGRNHFGEFSEKSYFGFVLSTEVVLKKQNDTGMAVSFLDDWKGKWEIFTKPFNAK